jgi:GT2 family glycosyltransferase
VRSRFPDLPIMTHEENLGFAGGNNSALRAVSAPFAVLANPDIVAPPGWLRALMTPLLSDETIAVAGSQTRYPNGSLQHAGGLIRPPQAIAAYRRDVGEEPLDVDYVIGAAFAVRMAALVDVGLLDDGYFLYYEEADLCTRLKRAGGRVVYVPAAHLTHVESATTPKGDATYLQRLHTSRWRYLLKHYAGRMLIEETLPAEARWLEERNPVERQAAGRAYFSTLRRYPEILAARARHGMPALPAPLARQLSDALVTLWAAASSGDDARLKRLAALATVNERPFSSAVPIVGPLIARFRAAWASVAVRWYMRALWAQQNRFNEILVNQLTSQQERFRQQAAEQAALVHGIAELQARVARLERRKD